MAAYVHTCFSAGYGREGKGVEMRRKELREILGNSKSFAELVTVRAYATALFHAFGSGIEIRIKSEHTHRSMILSYTLGL